MVAQNIGSTPIEIGDLGLKVKVTEIKNVFQNDKNNSLKISSIESHHSIVNFITVFLIPKYDHILQ